MPHATDANPNPESAMLTLIRPACVLLLLLTILTGIVYPLAITGVAALVFPRQAGGSLIDIGDSHVASELIGQPFTGDRYFWPRPSATGPFPYNAESGSGSNLGPTSEVLKQSVADRIAALRAAHPEHAGGPVPVDLVTASASGLDPDISVAAAEYQAHRVARARGMTAEQVLDLIRAHTTPRPLGLLGEARINTLHLNLALDRHEPSPPTRVSIGTRRPRIANE